jgi:hypothetical protein
VNLVCRSAANAGAPPPAPPPEGSRRGAAGHPKAPLARRMALAFLNRQRAQLGMPRLSMKRVAHLTAGELVMAGHRAAKERLFGSAGVPGAEPRHSRMDGAE